jgi:hypothetical protein
MSQAIYYEDAADFQGGYYEDYMDAPQYESPFDIGLPAPTEEFEGEENEHLRAENLYGTEKITFVMTIEGSLADFAKNPSLATWKLPADAQQFLRRVPTNVNRTHASKEDRAGNLARGISLKTHVIAAGNEFPLNFGVDVPGLVPKELTTHGRHNYVLPKNTQSTLGIREDISGPDSVFTEW